MNNAAKLQNNGSDSGKPTMMIPALIKLDAT